MANPVDAFPYPWSDPDAQALHATLCQIYPSPKGALFVAAKAGLDPAQLFADQSAFLLWVEVLDATATAKLTRTLVQHVVAQNPNNPRRGFLDALLASKPPAIDREPRHADGTPQFLRGTDVVTEPEALLFHDDLTLPIGRVEWLRAVLERLRAAAPAVCRLSVDALGVKQLGTGFRIAEDLLLTNWHVFYLYGNPTSVTAEFGYDDDGQGGGVASTAVPCDLGSIVTDEADDWGVIRVQKPLAAAIPVLRLSEAVAPAAGALAFLIQHPGGQRKRLAYVRNQVTDVDERVLHYLSDTETGSSGSPVLNDDGRLIGLHRAGGTPQEVAGKPPVKKNEGVRIERVLAGLAKAGVQTP
jgi:hypothetical protein